MILLVFVFVSIAILYAVHAGLRRWALFGATSLIVGLWASAAGPLPGAVMAWLQPIAVTDPDWGRDAVIVVVGIGTVRDARNDHASTQVLGYSRIVAAARLYRRCRAVARSCRIVVSGGDPAGTGTSEADAMAEDLIGLGVPSADLARESISRTTFENAVLTKRVLATATFDRVVVVTSGFHLRRARRYFRFVFAGGPDVVGVAADHVALPFAWIPRASYLTWMDVAAHEMLGEAQFAAYVALGWWHP